MMPEAQAIPPRLNLDRLAAERAQAIIQRTGESKASEVDNTVTKALGVLQENGLYAYFLFLFSRRGDETRRGQTVADETLQLLAGLNLGWTHPGNVANSQVVLTYVAATMLDDLDNLMLARDTCQQMLIYARYGAKARD